MINTSKTLFDMPQNTDIAWCPGCGNFGILESLKAALTELGLTPQNTVIVSGIGQAAKTPQYVYSNFFNGLHGRALPAATAIKASNPNLFVIAESGDGDMYGEGGNHFIHTIRRNPNITNLVHNNMIYGLTKGQNSPTTRTNNTSKPFNPIETALTLGATFVARAFSGDMQATKEILKQAINHKGYSLVDIFQPCVTFNKINTFKWFKENTYYLEDCYNRSDYNEAMIRAKNTEKFALGVIYQTNNLESFEDKFYKEETIIPLYKRRTNTDLLFDKIASRT